jgi:dihydroflavonol-4-reductase
MNLVTGSTGFVGFRLCRALIEAGQPLRAFHRSSSSLEALEHLGNRSFEHTVGDITQPETLKKAMQGVETVFHVAAAVSDIDPTALHSITVLGTRNVLAAAMEAGVKRVVHTSSVVALGVPRPSPSGLHLPINENHTWNYPPEWWRYGYAKYLAELEVQAAVARGLDVVVVNPAVIIGAGDVNRVQGGALIQIAKGRVPLAVSGGMNIVHIEDVVRGHMLARERGRCGHRYIIAGENLTVASFIALVAHQAGVRPPKLVLPGSLVRRTAGLLSFKPFRTRLPVSRDLVRMAGYYFYYDTTKAQQELGMGPPRPAHQAVADSIRFYRERGEL